MMRTESSISAALETLGARIEAYRVSRNMRQVDLAAAAGVSRATVSRLETGQGGTLDSLIRIMRALDLGDRLVDLVPEARQSPLDPIAAQGRLRRRATGIDHDADPDDWNWGGE